MHSLRAFTVFLVLLVPLATACQNDVQGRSERTQYQVRAARYFPPSEFRDLDGDQFLVPRFEETLAAMHEPILYERPTDERAVRVTWLPDSTGDKVLRIETSSKGMTTSSFKQYAFSGSALPNKLVAQKQVMVDPTGASTFWATVQQNDFFALTNNEDDTVVAGGTVVLLEVYERGQYHAVYRVGPLPGAVKNIVSAALRIAQQQ